MPLVQVARQPCVLEVDAASTHRHALPQQELALSAPHREGPVGPDDAVPRDVLLRRREDVADQTGRGGIDVAIRSDAPFGNLPHPLDDARLPRIGLLGAMPHVLKNASA